MSLKGKFDEISISSIFVNQFIYIILSIVFINFIFNILPDYNGIHSLENLLGYGWFGSLFTILLLFIFRPIVLPKFFFHSEMGLAIFVFIFVWITFNLFLFTMTMYYEYFDLDIYRLYIMIVSAMTLLYIYDYYFVNIFKSKEIKFVVFIENFSSVFVWIFLWILFVHDLSHIFGYMIASNFIAVYIIGFGLFKAIQADINGIKDLDIVRFVIPLLIINYFVSKYALIYEFDMEYICLSIIIIAIQFPLFLNKRLVKGS